MAKGSSRGERPATVRDVAKLAGVSVATVSLVLNGRQDRFSRETEERVIRAMELLGYRPNNAARQLKTRRSRVIGLVGHRIAAGAFGGGIIQGAQDYALEHDCTLFVVDTGSDGTSLRRALDVMASHQVDGVLFTSVMTSEVAPPEQLFDGKAVLVNCYATGTSRPCVLPDDQSGGQEATAALLQLGHRRIALVNGEVGTYPATEREKGYRIALREAGVPLDPQIVRHGNWNADTGYALSKELLTLDDPPSALFCGNDRMAVGAYFAILELGLSIGGDVSVLGYDNQTELAQFAHPPLASVELPYYRMGYLGAHILLGDAPSSRNMVSCQLMLRQSVGRIKPTTEEPAA